ncbi:MAG: NADH-quinone oxidoreductase subunit C [Euryarchaeota archaeon]|nr:NADH-quinone oxidoreductase subunit C [Euryarchaeota archaeon]
MEDIAYSVQEVKEKIVQTFSDVIFDDDKMEVRRLYMTADRSILFELCKFMKNDLGFCHCSLVSGVDRCDRFQTVYHITSYASNITAEIVVDLPHDEPEVDSITPLWGGANWHERETFDMFGIIFKNHPNLKRLLLPEDYKFFPMRKDCPEGGR